MQKKGIPVFITFWAVFHFFFIWIELIFGYEKHHDTIIEGLCGKKAVSDS